MRPLTEASQKNLARGATDGQGTMTCRKCHGPKEEARLNSGKCKACDTGVTPDPPAAPRTELDDICRWLVRHRLVLPHDVDTQRTPITRWAKSRGFPDTPKDS